MTTDPVGRAAEFHNAGRGGEAEVILRSFLDLEPDRADAHHLLGLVLLEKGDVEGCEARLRTALRLRPHPSALRTLTGLLLDQGRSEDAVRVQEAFAGSWAASPDATVDLADTLLKAGREAEAQAACRRAVHGAGAMSLDARIRLGRLCLRCARFDEAEAALRGALRLDPASVTAHRELAQLVWMRTGSLPRAREALDGAPQIPELTAVLVRLLQEAGEETEAYSLAAMRAQRAGGLHLLAARTAVTVDAQAAERHVAAIPPERRGDAWAKAAIEVDLALGRAIPAAARAEALHRERPNDPYVRALLGAAWRLAADPRAATLQASPETVGAYALEAPPGWRDVPGYLEDLTTALDAVHASLAHPIGQSVRGGSQTLRGLADYPHPAIRAVFAAIDPAIRRHMTKLGKAGAYRISGAWSVRLGRGGHHIDHVHAEGWLSSALHVRVPAQLTGRQGWLRFGRPGTPTLPPLAPEHYVRPQPGVLVLFPSSMWHGVEPFESDETRLSCAFDIVPG